MEILAYIVLGFAIIQLMVSLANLVWAQKLPPVDSGIDDLVSILIPARNEEKNIGELLNDLEELAYPYIEILVYNDQSTDNTEKIVIEQQKIDSRIRLLHSKGLPDGWTGKNHACFSLAQQAKGKYLLFVDADVRVSGLIVSQSISMAKYYDLALLSIFPKQVMKTRGEEFTVPLMNYVLLSLLPLILVRTIQFTSLSAANGQFMFFDTATYHKLQPHKNIRNKRVEDIEIARMYKQNNEKISCLTGNDDIRCRMYHGYSEAVNGLSRSVLMFFGNSALIAIFFWMITTLGFIPVVLGLTWQFFLLYLCILLITRVAISLNSRQNAIKNVAYGFIQKINLGIVIGKALRARSVKKIEWKGRLVSSS